MTDTELLDWLENQFRYRPSSLLEFAKYFGEYPERWKMLRGGVVIAQGDSIRALIKNAVQAERRNQT